MLMRETLLALLVLLLIGCGGVSEKEAQQTLTSIETISGADESMRTVLLGSLCMESEGCMGSCKDVLKALGQAAPEDRILLVRQCDPSAKPADGQSEREGFDRWMVGYVDPYVKKVRSALPEGDRPRLDKAWAAFQK